MTGAGLKLLDEALQVGRVEVRGARLRAAERVVAECPDEVRLVPRGPDGEVVVPFAAPGWAWYLERAS